jgi:O-antigen/teichoic acid export membrane protein
MPPTENSSARILDNISALAIAQIVAMAAGFFSTAWVARLLGPEGYGIIGFGVAFTSFFGLMVVLGTDYYGSREIAQNPDKAQALAAKIIGLRFVLATVTLTIYFTIIYFIDRSQPVKIVMIIQAIGTVFIVIAIDFIFEGRQRMRAVAVRLGGTSVLSLVCILLFVRGSEDVYIAAAIPVLATAIGTIWLFGLAHKEIVPLRISFNRSALTTVFKDCAPIAIAGFMGALFLNIDIVMLGFLRSEAETGLYTGMARLYILVFALGNLVTVAFRPAIAAAFPDSGAMVRQYGANMTIVVLFGFPIVAGVIAFPGEIVELSFGAGFAAAADALVILQIAGMFGYIGIAAVAALIAWHDQLAQMWCHAAVAVLNIVLNIFLIPKYGIEGAAWATLIAQLVMLLSLTGRLQLKFSVGVWRPVLILIPCAALAFWLARQFADWAQDWPSTVVLFTGLTVGTVIYIGMAFIFRIISFSDLTKLISQRIRLKRGGV